MQGEPILGEASFASGDTIPRGSPDTVEILFAWGPSTSCETRRVVLEPDAGPGQLRAEPAGDELVVSGATTDVLVLADVADNDDWGGDVDRLRAQNPDCRILGVVEAGSDVGLADSCFDEVLVRPVSSARLLDGVRRLLRRRTYSRLVWRHSSVAFEVATLEAENTSEQLDRSQEYATLSEELATIESELAGLPETLDSADFEALMRELER